MGSARGIAAVVALLWMAGPAAAAVAPPAVTTPDDGPRCHGRRPTIVGTDGNDSLRGTPHRDVIWGGLGDDVIRGGLGNDLLCGGPGADLVHGGRGNDVVDGGAGDRDIAVGDLGDDQVFGGTGNHDEAGGGLGIDIVNGGPGNFDLVHGDYGWDVMSGGKGGGDIASFGTAVSGAKGRGVWVSLKRHMARGDGHDRLHRFEAIAGSAFADKLYGDDGDDTIDGGPGDDLLDAGKGNGLLNGGQGSDRCKGGARHVSCGPEPEIHAPVYVQLDPTPGGGGGLSIVGGAGDDDVTVAFDAPADAFSVSATKGIAIGPGCLRPPTGRKQVTCPVGGPARWMVADLGADDDSFRVYGSLQPVEFIRIAGGKGDDSLHGGPEDDLIESGPGSDRLYGGPGADGLIGGLPGPTSLYGGANGDLLAAGGGCAGGRLVGGPGRDNASFAETQAHPGELIISLPLGRAWINAIPDCDAVGISKTNENLEGSFDNDIIVGDSRANYLLGQPGADRFYGGGGDDVIDARDGMRDFSIQCGRGRYVRIPPQKKGGKPSFELNGKPQGRSISDSFDPSPVLCAAAKHGKPIPGL